MVDQDTSTATNRDDPKQLEPIFTAYCAALEQGHNALPIEYKYRATRSRGSHGNPHGLTITRPTTATSP